jgi:thiol-disulfide isomerase/thioredoxin
MIALFILPICAFSQKVYDFTLPDAHSSEILSFNSLKGEKLTLIDFWATWCKPCMAAIPKIEAIFQTYKDSGLNVIGINVDSPRNLSKIAPFTKSLGIKYPVLLDTEQVVMRDLNVTSLPTLLIVDNNNKVVYFHEGFQPGHEIEIENQIRSLLNKSTKQD